MAKKRRKKSDASDKTPTQLRNARKRNAKQRAKLEAPQLPAPDSKKPRIDLGEIQDPSSKYLSDPLQAPVVGRARAHFRSLGLATFPVHVGPTLGWRTHSKLAVQSDPSGEGVLVGLFEPGSTRVVEVLECPVHHPSINLAVKAVKKACARYKIRGCSLESSEGDLRYLVMSVDQAGAVQLSLVWNQEPQPEPPALLQRLRKKLTKRGTGPKAKFPLHSLWVHYHAFQQHNSAIFSRKENSWQLLEGPETLTFQLPLDCYPVTLHFTPNVFQQANIAAFTNIIAAIREKTREFGERENGSSLPALVELYAGVGTIGLHLCELASRLACSDENPHNLRCFELTRASMPEPLRPRANYSSRPAAQVALQGDLRSAALCVVDPPRKGLDPEVIEALLRPGNPRRLIYVSCGFSALQRDLAQLLGPWKLSHAEGFLLFPGSDHIETLVVLDR